MSSDSDPPPSSVLGPQQDLLKCGDCGQCIDCQIGDLDYYLAADLEDTGNIEQKTAYVEEASGATSRGNLDYQRPSGESKKRKLRHWFWVPPSPIGEKVYDTRQPSNSGVDQADTIPSWEEHDRRLRDLLELSPKKNLDLMRTDQSSTSSGNPKYQRPSGEVKKRQLPPSFSIGEERYQTGQLSNFDAEQNDPHLSREAQNRRLRDLLELSPTSNLEIPMSSDSDPPPSSVLGSQQDLLKCGGCGQCFECQIGDFDYYLAADLEDTGNIEQTTAYVEETSGATSRGNLNYQRPSGESNKRKLRPWLWVLPSPIGEKVYDTRQPSNSGVDQADNTSNLEIPGTEQPSASSLERGYRLPISVSSNTQLRSTITSLLNYSSEKSYRTGQSSISRRDLDDYSSSEGKDRISKARRLECKDGGEKVLSPPSLNFHRHTGESEKEFKCESCGKSYNQKSSLRVHEKVHTRVTKPTCVKCGKSYSTEGYLKEHQRYACGSYELKCRFCGRTFTRKSSLKNHEIFKCRKR